MCALAVCIYDQLTLLSPVSCVSPAFGKGCHMSLSGVCRFALRQMVLCSCGGKPYSKQQTAPLPGTLFYVYSEHLGYSCALSYSSRVLTFVYILRGGRLQYLTMVKYCTWFCSHGDENNTVVFTWDTMGGLSNEHVICPERILRDDF